jgi:hypothetical protein
VNVEEATVSVMVEVPAPVIEPGLKATVTPEGWPLAASETAELKPPVTALVIVEVPELPCTTETEAGDADRLKPGGTGAVTVRETVAVSVMLPEVPVTVIGYVPAAVRDATVIVMAEVPESGAAMGLVPKLTVTPAG